MQAPTLVDPSDVTLLLLANGGVLRQSASASMAASLRLLASFLLSCLPTLGMPLADVTFWTRVTSITRLPI